MRARLAGPALCISLLLVAACGRPPAAPSAEAERILAETASFYQRQSSYRVRSRLEATLHDKYGIAIQEAEPVVDDRTIIVRNTDEFCVEAGQLRFASDGIHLRLNPVQRAAQSDQPGSEKVPYWRADAPARLSEMTSSPLASLLRAPRSLACLGFFDPGLETLLRRNGELVALEGRETVGGVAAHHLTIKLPVSDSAPRAMDVTEIWVAAEGDPVVLQMKVSPAPQLRQFDHGQVECSTYTLETFQGWEFDTDGPPGAFAPPENGRRVAELRELIDGRSPMIGEPAPPTSLQLLDGTTESLEELRAAGKIVLLDFWATWCGPCRTELPFVAQIAEEFGGQGVILYGVNQQESADQVRRFMEEQTYRMTAALDETGAIGNAFQVQSLPSLFIIGRDGTVQVQHVGIGPDTEKAIRDEVAALAAGRNVAADGLPDEDSEPSE